LEAGSHEGASVSADADAAVAAVLAALRDGFLAGNGGPDTWQRTTVLARLSRGIRAEQWTIAELLGRYHLMPRDLADTLAALSWEWYCTRPPSQDTEWSAATRPRTAATLRRDQRLVHIVRDLVRDLGPQLVRHFDASIEESRGQKWTAEQAHELGVRETVATAILGLGPDASEDEIGRRLTALYPDLPFHPPLEHDAILFAPDAIKGLNGTALVQATLVGLSLLDVVLLGHRGLVVTGRGPRRLLDLERDLGGRLIDFFRACTGRPLWGHAAILLAAACPSRTLVKWRDEARDTAVKSIPLHQRRERAHWSSNELPPCVRGVYRRTFAEKLRVNLATRKRA
jgi:hypothetical protein